MTRLRRAGSATAAILVALAVSACSSSPPAPPVFDKNVTIGVALNTPGWNAPNASGQRVGFDHDLIDWLASEIGFRVSPVEITAGVREEYLQSGQVILVVATYSMTDSRCDAVKGKVGCAGPYMFGHQGVMVRAQDQEKFQRIADLAGKSVCVTRGSTSAEEVRALGVRTSVTEYERYDQCIDALAKGDIDAVSTDQLLLYGHLQRNPGFVVPRTITFGQQQRYGIGFPKGDTAKCDKLTEKIRKFLSDNTWEEFFSRNLPGVDPAGHKADPNQMRPC